MNKLSDIDVSLSRGQLYGKKQLVVGWIGIISAVLLMTLGIASIILSCIEWDVQIFSSALMGVVIGAAFLAVLIYYFIQDKMIKKEVSLWLQDASIVQATSEEVDSFRAGFQPIGVKIRVRFDINGIAYARESTTKVFGGKIGYSNAFKKYTNRKIKIMYSPKYDEVMILK